MIRIGGPVFLGKETAARAGESHGSSVDNVLALVNKHKEKGFRAAYAPQVKLSERDRIRKIREAFGADDRLWSCSSVTSAPYRNARSPDKKLPLPLLPTQAGFSRSSAGVSKTGPLAAFSANLAKVRTNLRKVHSRSAAFLDFPARK